MASTSASTEGSTQAPTGDLAEGVANLPDDPRMRIRHDLSALRRVLAEEVPLALREAGGNDDVHEDVEIALRSAAEVRHAPPAQANLGSWLGPGLDLDVLVALDRGDRDRRAEGGLDDRDVRLVEELGALAAEHRMRRDVHGH